MGNLVQTQAKLTKAAIQLFATKGYKATTIRDIAKATGMTVSNTYYHFGSKHGLLLAVLDRLSNELQAELEQVCQLDLDPLERFKQLVRTHLDRVAADRHSSALFFQEEEGLTPATNELAQKAQIDFLGIYRRELQNLQAAGYLRSRNITILAFHIIALVQWHFRWYRPEGRLSLEEIKEEALNFILNGILKGPEKKKTGRANPKNMQS